MQPCRTAGESAGLGNNLLLEHPAILATLRPLRPDLRRASSPIVAVRVKPEISSNCVHVMAAGRGLVHWVCALHRGRDWMHVMATDQFLSGTPGV